MSYQSSGNQGYYASGQAGGYGAYAPQSSGRGGDSSPLPGYLTLAVAALGVASYLVSYGPVREAGGIDWDVRFAVLAGLLAAFGLAPGQKSRSGVVAALATVGFFDALSSRITEAGHLGWALTVIVVLNGLQAVAAIAALYLGAEGAGDRGVRSDYDAYADYYARAAQYYGQYNQQQPKTDTLQRAAHAQVAAHHSQQAAASQAGSYAEYVGGSGQAPASAPQRAAPAGPQAGLPNFAAAPAPVQQSGEYANLEHRPTSQQ